MKIKTRIRVACLSLIRSLRCWHHVIELLSQLIFPAVEDTVHGRCLFSLNLDALQVIIQVCLELLFIDKNEHASETAEHSLIITSLSHLIEHKIGLCLLILAELDLSLAAAHLLSHLHELGGKFLHLGLVNVCHS